MCHDIKFYHAWNLKTYKKRVIYKQQSAENEYKWLKKWSLHFWDNILNENHVLCKEFDIR